jgi:MoaA/NifB/PqqE/SkfB family radical SAM enzyme
MRLLGLLLRLRDTDDVEIDLVSATSAAPMLPAGAAPRALAPGAPRSAEWLNLAVNTECAQACQFCSVLEVSPAWTKDLRFERLLLDLRSNAEAGVRRVRLNGYDPLTHPRVLELAHAVKQLGYAEVMVFSPCTVLADADFLDALLEALPPAPAFHVPVYGPTAEVHDRVVGRAGSFERVARALELLGERLPRENLVVTSVAVRDNVAHLLELRRWALQRAIRFHVQTPYPSSESPSDRYHTSVARLRDIAAETMREGESVIVNGVPPCVYFARGEALGIDPKSWLRDEQRPLPGREYVAGAFSHRALVVQHSVSVPPAVACPHREECALATACPREVLRAYADTHGLDELEPVRLSALLR